MAKTFLARGHDVRVLTAQNQIFPQTLQVETPEQAVYRTSWINVNRLPISLSHDRDDFYLKGYSRSNSLLSILGNLYKSFLNLPDGQVGWLPFGLREGARLITTWRPDVIYASAMPFTSLIVASRLSRRFKIPWIAEFRDLWVGGPYYDYPPWRRWLEAPLERAVIRGADGLVTVSDPLADTLRKKFGKPTATILNGYDSEDIPAVSTTYPPDRERLNIVYTGMVYPGRRDPSSLFEAIARLGEEGKRVRVRFFGRMLPGVEELAKKYGVQECVELHGPVSHRQSLRHQIEADLLLLLLWNDPREHGVYTGKLFEYLGARRPIIALGLEDGVAASLIRERAAGIASNDPGDLCSHLHRWITQKYHDGVIPKTGAGAAAGFSRLEQFTILESFIEKLLAGRREKSRSPLPTKRRADVLVVIGQLDMGGTENHLLKVLPRLRDRGIDPRVFAIRRGGVLEEPLAEAGVPVLGIPAWLGGVLGLIAGGFSLLVLYVKERPGVVHFFLPHAYVIGGIGALLSGQKPRIMSRRSLNKYQQRHPILIPLERWLHPKMDAVLGNSRAVVSQLKEEGVASEKLGLIYNGLDLKSFKPTAGKRQLRKNLDLPARALVLVTVANLIPYKGHCDLLTAMSGIRHRLPVPWILLLVGRNDGIEGELRDLAGELGIGPNVRWLGERYDVPDVLTAADIAVLPSHEEGFSNSVLEAMAMRLPIVLTDVGGNTEVVIHGDSGLVVPAHNPPHLGDAILALSCDPKRRRQMGKAARQRIRTQFSLDAAVEQYSRLYTEYLKVDVPRAVSQVLE